MTNIASTNDSFETVLPACIDYAEQRISRELDMLVADVTDAASSLVANDRTFTLPTTFGKFQVISQINVITPAGTAPAAGTRNQCVEVSQSVLDRIYPSVTGADVPAMFAYVSQSSLSSQTNLVFGPWPAAAYRVEVIGKIIPAALSDVNPTTFLSLYLPDLFLAASMVFMAGYKGNFGAQADDPKAAMSWEQQYQALKSSAATWEARKRFAGASWSSKQVEPTAQPQRG